MPVDCIGQYHVEANDEDEAKQMLADWNGSAKNISFSHYSEEWPASTTEEMDVELNE